VCARLSQKRSFLIEQVVWAQKRDLTVSVQRRRPLLGFDIELHEPVEQRGLSKEVASAILVAQRCVVSVLPCSPASLGNGKDRPKGEVAALKNVWVAVDPKATFKGGPVNGRKARESGLRLKA